MSVPRRFPSGKRGHFTTNRRPWQHGRRIFGLLGVGEPPAGISFSSGRAKAAGTTETTGTTGIAETAGIAGIANGRASRQEQSWGMRFHTNRNLTLCKRLRSSEGQELARAMFSRQESPQTRLRAFQRKMSICLSIRPPMQADGWWLVRSGCARRREAAINAPPPARGGEIGSYGGGVRHA